MNLWKSLRERFGGTREKNPPPQSPRYSPPPSALRNKPGGLAWIRVRDVGDGAFVLNRRVVKTVCTDAMTPGFWVIDPPQKFQAQCFLPSMSGGLIPPGAEVCVLGMHDDLLEPIRDVGEDERDESVAWLPTVPMGAVAPEKA